MSYELPTSIEIEGIEYDIRSDYRPILDIMEALDDPELNDQEKMAVMLDIFYPNFSDMPMEHYQQAVDYCVWFINGGEENPKKTQKSPRLMSWTQDFHLIVAPINKIAGKDIRGIPYNRRENDGGFHWWTLLSAYMEIGDCLFAQVVSIRRKKLKHQKLDKSDQEFYKNNRHLIDFKVSYTEAENEIIKQWTNEKSR